MSQLKFVALALFLSTLALSPRAQGARTLEVINLLPPGTDQLAAQQQQSKELGATLEYLSPPPELLEAVGWTLEYEGREACLEIRKKAIEVIKEKGIVSVPAVPEELLATLLAQVKRQILFVEYDHALSTLGHARKVMTCSSHIVAQSEIRDLFLNIAIAHLHMRDGLERNAFLNVLAVAPDVELEADHAPKIRRAYMDAAEEWSHQPAKKLKTDQGYGELFVDGQPASAMKEIRAGTHLLQLKSPSNEVRTELVEITQELRVVALRQMASFGLPSTEKARTALASSLGTYQLSEPMRQILDRRIESEKRMALFFAIAGNETGQASTILYRRETGASLYTRQLLEAGQGIPPEVSAEKENESDRLGLRTGLAMGLQLLPDTSSGRFANGEALGSVFHAEYPVGPVVLLARAGFYPSALRSSAETCAPEDPQSLTEDDLESAIACLPSHPSFGLNFGTGLPIQLSENLRLVPGLVVGAIYISEVVVVKDSNDLNTAVVDDGVAYGPILQARLGYALPGALRNVELTFDLVGGIRYATIANSRVLAIPIGLSVGASHTF